MWVYKYLLKTLLSNLLNIYQEEEVLGHMEMLFLIFWVTSLLLSTVAVPLYIPINSEGVSNVFTCLSTPAVCSHPMVWGGYTAFFHVILLLRNLPWLPITLS